MRRAPPAVLGIFVTLILGGIVGIAVACGPTKSIYRDDPVDAAHVDHALARYSKLVRKMDHARIAAMFASGGELWSAGHAPIHGPTAIRSFLEGFAGYHVLANHTDASRTTVVGDSAVQVGTYRQRVRTPEGKVLNVSGGFEAHWVRGPDGAWLIQGMGTTPNR